MFKINVDGATFENERNSSVGVVIRDATGTIHVACYKYLQGQYLVEVGKALAMDCGLILAREQKLPQIILESDALTVVNRVTTAEANGSLGHVYKGILNLLSSFSSWRINHVKKEYNRAAHELAQYARQNEVSHVLLWCLTLSRQIVLRLYCVVLLFLCFVVLPFLFGNDIPVCDKKKIYIYLLFMVQSHYSRILTLHSVYRTSNKYMQRSSSMDDR